MNATKVEVPELHVGMGTQAGPLTVFPIWTSAPLADSPGYLLPEAGAVGIASELAEGPSVTDLVIDNPHLLPLLVLEGMTLDGGWQHRVLTRSVLAPPRRRTQIPVRCVEQSRWDGARAQRFASFDAPMRVRGSLRGLGEADAGSSGPSQGRVWTDVAAYESELGPSPTNSLHDLQVRQSRTLVQALQHVRPLPGQRGVIIAALGHPVLGEIHDHPAALAQRWDSIILGMAVDVASVPAVPTPAWRARSFARAIMAAETEVTGPAGAGISVEAEDRGFVSLRGIAEPGHLLHAGALNVRHQLCLAA